MKCLQCGAEIDNNYAQCPHCGVQYFDFTDINFNDNKPAVFRFKFDNNVITFLARPAEASIETRPYPVQSSDLKISERDMLGGLLNEYEMTMNMSLEAIPDAENHLYQWTKESNI